MHSKLLANGQDFGRDIANHLITNGLGECKTEITEMCNKHFLVD